jgi:hypothetical protein
MQNESISMLNHIFVNGSVNYTGIFFVHYSNSLTLSIPNSFVIVLSYFFYHVGGVMVNVLASGVADRGFEPWPGQTKDYTICICCFSAKSCKSPKFMLLLITTVPDGTLSCTPVPAKSKCGRGRKS